MLIRPGDLLVASPMLVDPHFADAVVLILHHDPTGTLGVILNRDSDLALDELLPEWSTLVGEPRVLFRGGPVARDGILGLGRLADPSPAPASESDPDGDTPPGWREVMPGCGLVDLDDPGACADALSALRLFSGYAGWDPGQLADEIEEGSWHVVPGTVADVFTPAYATLWRDVLRRQPGPLAWVATRPVDPGLN